MNAGDTCWLRIRYRRVIGTVEAAEDGRYTVAVPVLTTPAADRRYVRYVAVERAEYPGELVATARIPA